MNAHNCTIYALVNNQLSILMFGIATVATCNGNNVSEDLLAM